jgi:diguanylate cyclase (GGDEF)-like protein/PAS domain S-box-containing protein
MDAVNHQFWGEAGDRLYREVVEALDDGVWALDAGGRTTFVNHRVAEMLGYSPDEMLGRHLLDFKPERERAATSAHLDRRSQGRGGTYVTSFLHRDGHDIGADVVARSITDEHGRHIASVAVIREHRGRGLTEADYRTLVDHAPDAICIFDPAAGRFVDVNPAAERLFGRGRFELLAVDAVRLSPERQPDGRRSADHIEEQLSRARAGETIEFEWMILHADGREIPCEIQVTRLPGPRFRTRASLRDVSERRAAQRALHESEQLYRTIVETAAEGIAMVDTDYRITFANERFAEMLGYPLPELIGRRVEDLASTEGRELILAGRERRLAGQTGRYELPMLHADGSTVWCQLSAAPLLDEHGRVVGAVGMHTDVTERRLAEARARALTEHVSDIVSIMGEDLRFVWASSATERVLGFPVDQIIGMFALDLVHPDDHPTAIDGIVELFASPGAQVRREVRVRRADGTYLHGEVLAVNQLDDPVLSGIILSTRDVSDRYEAAQALKHSEARNRSIVETAADAILTIGGDGTVLTLNRAAELIFGWSEHEVRGMPARTFLPQESLETVQSAVNAGEARSISCDALRRDGSSFPIELSLSLIELDGQRTITAIARDVTVQRAFEARLEALALHDTLTGLPNRRRLLERIEEAMARSRRRGAMLAVLFCDLDRFKVVNDSLGHDAGDQLLVTAAMRIGSVIRDTDTLARLGGDEFVILCEEVESVGEVTEIARRVAAALEQPFEVRGTEAFVTTSIGVALWNGGSETPLDMLRNADTAMYRAKDGGRNRFEIFDEAMQAWASARLEYESALRRAIERDELRVHYQPIVELDGGAPVAVEALVRWDRGDLGIVAPGEFIALAEETGLIVPIGAWVLERACRDCVSWQVLAPGVGVSVNLSPRQLAATDALEVVVNVLDVTGLPARLLCLEITESVLMDDAPRNLDMLHALVDVGVRLALDDFGTGYSSLTYLRRFPIDTLKIDQSFVRPLADGGDTTIVRAIVDLARALGLTVVAEGIDSASKLASLRAIGCEVGQGYLFARPEPITALRSRLQGNAARALESVRGSQPDRSACA